MIVMCIYVANEERGGGRLPEALGLIIFDYYGGLIII